MRLAVGPEGVALDAEHHVVVGHQPVEERPRRVGLLRSAAAIAQPRRQLGDAPAHGGEVLDAEEHRLQHREHLVLDAAQAVAGFDALDAELAVELARAVLLRAADPDHALPLAADAEDRMDRREDAEPFLLEVVLEALEDERRVGRVGLDDRHFVRRSLGARLGVVGVADGDVQPGQALVQLDGRRHRARDEAEDAGQPRRDHVGGEPQRQGVRHVAVDDGREGEEQVAIGVRRGAADVIEDAGKRRDPALRVGGDHGPSEAPNPRRGCPLYPEHSRPGRVIRGAMAGRGHHMRRVLEVDRGDARLRLDRLLVARLPDGGRAVAHAPRRVDPRGPGRGRRRAGDARGAAPPSGAGDRAGSARAAAAAAPRRSAAAHGDLRGRRAPRHRQAGRPGHAPDAPASVRHADERAARASGTPGGRRPRPPRPSPRSRDVGDRAGGEVAGGPRDAGARDGATRRPQGLPRRRLRHAAGAARSHRSAHPPGSGDAADDDEPPRRPPGVHRDRSSCNVARSTLRARSEQAPSTTARR